MGSSPRITAQHQELIPDPPQHSFQVLGRRTSELHCPIPPSCSHTSLLPLSKANAILQPEKGPIPLSLRWRKVDSVISVTFCVSDKLMTSQLYFKSFPKTSYASGTETTRITWRWYKPLWRSKPWPWADSRITAVLLLLTWNSPASSNTDHALLKGKARRVHEFNLTTPFAVLFSSQCFARCLFPVFFHPGALSPLCFFFELFIQALLCHRCPSASFLCYHRSADIQLCFRCATLQRPAGAPCLSGRPNNNPPITPLSVCPHEGDFRDRHSLTVQIAFFWAWAALLRVLAEGWGQPRAFSIEGCWGWWTQT